jgi:hypothetical protein
MSIVLLEGYASYIVCGTRIRPEFRFVAKAAGKNGVSWPSATSEYHTKGQRRWEIDVDIPGSGFGFPGSWPDEKTISRNAADETQRHYGQ